MRHRESGACEFDRCPGHLLGRRPRSAFCRDSACTADLLPDRQHNIHPPPRDRKPKLKRNMGVLKYGSRRHGDLIPALVAAQQRCSHRRTLPAPTARAAKTLRPTKLTQVLAAILIAAKACVELLQVSRVVFHHHAYYGW